MKSDISTNKKVVVIQKSLIHYRIAFHELIKKKLNNINIEYELIYGKATGEESLKNDEVEISWAKRINNKVIYLFIRSAGRLDHPGRASRQSSGW